MKIKRTISTIEIIAQTIVDYELLCVFSHFFDTPIRYNFVYKEYRVIVDEIDWLKNILKKHEFKEQ